MACWLYTATVVAVLLFSGGGPRTGALADWEATPLQVVAMAVCAALARQSSRLSGQARTVAALAGVYALIVFAANVCFNVWRPLGKEPGLLVTDLLYMAGYLVYATIFCASYRYLGGSFRSQRFWTDTGIIVATLLAILLVAGAFTAHRATDSWLLLGLVVSCMVLIVTRQTSVRRELAELNRALAIREADLRLAELVRQSKDLILIVHGDGIVRFASAAASAVVGVSASALQGMPFVRLMGRDHEAALAGFLNELLETPSRSAALEMTLDGEANAARTVHVSGLNQLDSALIGGLTVTIADVTGQRALEREVLNVATRERVRLAADIHDGVGQELVGIAMLLQGAATGRSSGAESQRSQLEGVIRQLNGAIGGIRALARGLSPLQVVRGSLSYALQRLVLDENGPLEVLLEIDANVESRTIDDVAADHVYRIAHEAVRNAIRHSGGRTVSVTCAVEDEHLVLSVADDGRGITRQPLQPAGIGLQLMQYRAHMIRGNLTVDSLDAGGTCICLTVPLRHLRQERP